MKALKIEQAFTSYDDYNGLGGYSKHIEVISHYSKDCPVFIHYRMGSVWNNVAMKLKQTSDEFCIWEYTDRKEIDSYNKTDAPSVLPEETDIAFFQDTPMGRVWDNNNWKNYHLGSCDGPLLGQGIGILLYDSYFNAENTFGGTIIVTNLDYQKDITVVYKTDKSQTSSICKASFSEFFQVGYGQFVISPNSNNCDIFTFSSVQNDCKTIEFYLTYEVNGQYFIDNNRGKNYIVTKE